MALTDSDRRRFLVATALTLVALPALWWANQDDGAPSVATAGIVVDGGADATEPDPTVPAADPADAPVFLDGPSGQVGAGLAEIAVPVQPKLERITTKAVFRSNVGSPGTCTAPGVNQGASIVVVNLDNNRSVRCTARLAPSGSADFLVMHPDLFAEIADLTDSPIPVEIRR
ncbi:MAG: hypothetical protein WBL31_10545 [Ilumatobacteraceae bacterium]